MVWSMITLFTNGWGLLFGGPKDGTLSNAARNECLALLTQNEITGRGLTITNDNFPRKQMFLDHASTMVDCLPHDASVEQKALVQSMLCMDYLASKNGLSIDYASKRTKTNHYKLDQTGSIYQNLPLGDTSTIIPPPPWLWLQVHGWYQP